MAIDKIQAESINLADTFAFTGTVSGAGTWVLLNTTTVNGQSRISFSSSLITSSYKTYVIRGIGISMSTDGTDYGLDISENNGSSYPSTNSMARENFYDDTFRITRQTSAETILIASSLDGDNANSNGTLSFDLYCFNMADTANYKNFYWTQAQTDQSGVASTIRNGCATHQSNSAVNNLSVRPINGTQTGGTLQLWGIA